MPSRSRMWRIWPALCGTDERTTAQARPVASRRPQRGSGSSTPASRSTCHAIAWLLDVTGLPIASSIPPPPRPRAGWCRRRTPHPPADRDPVRSRRRGLRPRGLALNPHGYFCKMYQRHTGARIAAWWSSPARTWTGGVRAACLLSGAHPSIRAARSVPGAAARSAPSTTSPSSHYCLAHSTRQSQRIRTPPFPERRLQKMVDANVLVPLSQ